MEKSSEDVRKQFAECMQSAFKRGVRARNRLNHEQRVIALVTRILTGSTSIQFTVARFPKLDLPTPTRVESANVSLVFNRRRLHSTATSPDPSVGRKCGCAREQRARTSAREPYTYIRVRPSWESLHLRHRELGEVSTGAVSRLFRLIGFYSARDF